MILYHYCSRQDLETTNVLKGLFSEAWGLFLPWFCMVKKSRDWRGNASVFSSNRKSHISKWKPFRNKAAIMFLWKGFLPFALRYLIDKWGKKSRRKKCEKLFDKHFFPALIHLTFPFPYRTSIYLHLLLVCQYCQYVQPSHLWYLRRN